LRLLLAAGIDPNIEVTDYSDTPLLLLSYWYRWGMASFKKRHILLRQKGMLFESKFVDLDNDRFHFQRDMKSIFTLLLDFGADINKPNKVGLKPIGLVEDTAVPTCIEQKLLSHNIVPEHAIISDSYQECDAIARFFVRKGAVPVKGISSPYLLNYKKVWDNFQIKLHKRENKRASVFLKAL